MSELIECPHCKKIVAWFDWSPGNCCDECFEKMLDQEEEDLDVFHLQKGNCFVCGVPLSGWIIREIDGVERAVCWPSHEERLPGPITLSIK